MHQNANELTPPVSGSLFDRAFRAASLPHVAGPILFMLLYMSLSVGLSRPPLATRRT
jgi:hypothetical protein